MTKRWQQLSCFALGLALLTLSSRAEAGAYTWEPGHFYLQLSTSFSWANDKYDDNGNKSSIKVLKNNFGSTSNKSDYQQLLSDLYWEVGIFKRVTFFGDFPFLSSARQHNDGGNITYAASGISDILTALRFGILEQPFALALETRLTFASGNANRIIPTGQGDTRGEIRLVATKQLTQIPIYFDFEFGFTFRGHANFTSPINGPTSVDYAPEMAIHGEVGGTVVRWKGMDRLLLVLSADWRQSTTNPADTLTFFSVTPAASQQVWVNGSAMAYIIRNLGVNFRYGGMVAGERLPVLQTVGGGIFGTW